MRILLLNHIQNARDSLRSNRMRTFLTALGVTIGVASITAILALGDGASKVVGNQVDALGGNLAIIRPGKDNTSSQVVPSAQGNQYAASTLTEQDVTAITSVENVAAVAPLMLLDGTIRGDAGTAPAGSTIVATLPDFQSTENLRIDSGQFLSDETDNNTAVIGAQLSVNIFGTDQSIGKLFSIRGQEFRVIGILKRENRPIGYNNFDTDNTALIHLAAGKQLHQGTAQIQQINLKADSVQYLDRVIIDTNKLLLKNHQNEHDFRILSGSAIAEPTSQLFYAIAGVTATIAAISLIVGGVGIMNIMLVNVAERTREIGIRKALGAGQADIVWQFLIESLIIGIIGGVFGCAIGFAGAFVTSTFLTFAPTFSWQIAAIALGTAAITGVLFGLYPSIRAARKNPIDSLRHYN